MENKLKYLTRKDIEFTTDGIHILGTDTYFGGFRGALKIINFGEEPFKKRMERIHGKKKAKEILKTSSARGNKIHEKLETNWKEELPAEVIDDLGEQVAYEVFVHGELWGVNALGFIDAIFIKDGLLTLVDYKTKTKPYYKQSFDKYWQQLIIYSTLITQMFPEIEAVRMATIILYTDGSEPTYKVLEDKKETQFLAKQVFKKCKLITAAVPT